MTGKQIWEKLGTAQEIPEAQRFDLQIKLLPHWEEEVPADLMAELDQFIETPRETSEVLEQAEKEYNTPALRGELTLLRQQVDDVAQAVGRLTEYLLKQLPREDEEGLNPDQPPTEQPASKPAAQPAPEVAKQKPPTTEPTPASAKPLDESTSPQPAPTEPTVSATPAPAQPKANPTLATGTPLYPQPTKAVDRSTVEKSEQAELEKVLAELGKVRQELQPKQE